MAHSEQIISQIKIPNAETPYDVCDKEAIHIGDEITIDEINEICGQTIEIATLDEVTF